MSKKNKTKIKIKIDKKVKVRNELARIAHFKSGAGTHKDRKKEANKKVCRKKIKFWVLFYCPPRGAIINLRIRIDKSIKARYNINVLWRYLCVKRN